MLVLVASALRVVVLPQLARAREAGRLGARGRRRGRSRSRCRSCRVVVVALVASGTLARALTGGGGRQDAAAELLPWLVPAAAAQIYAGIAASGLAALGDYGTAALGFGLGAVVGLAVIAAFADHGVVAWGWGLAANGAIALGSRSRCSSPGAASAARRARLAAAARPGRGRVAAVRAAGPLPDRLPLRDRPRRRARPTTFSYAI